MAKENLLSVRVDDTIYKSLQSLARKKERTIADLVREFVISGLLSSYSTIEAKSILTYLKTEQECFERSQFQDIGD